MGCEYTEVTNDEFEVFLDADESYSAFHEHLAECDRCQVRADKLFTENASTLGCLNELQHNAGGDWSVESDFTFSTEREANEYDLETIGRYEILREIGRGGMGQVFLASDRELQRVVALKLLAPHLAGNGPARQRFAREAQAAAAVLHPNVLPIHDVNESEDLPYLVMQYVPGTSLQLRVDKTGPLGIADVLRIANQTASALHAAHLQGLIHRDVKPSNILLENETDRAVLGDFGLARTVDEASVTQTGIVAGTPHYMSPEQAEGEAITQLSDQFSLGSCIYFMLAGRPPFRAESAMGILHCVCKKTHTPIQQLNSEVPLELSRLVDRLLSKRRESRYRDCEQVAKELERLLSMFQRGKLRLGTSRSLPAVMLTAFAAALLLSACLFSISQLNWFAAAVPTEQEAASSIAETDPVREPGIEDEIDDQELTHVPGVVSDLSNDPDAWFSELTQLDQQINALTIDPTEPTLNELLETQLQVDQDSFDRQLQELENEIQNY